MFSTYKKRSNTIRNLEYASYLNINLDKIEYLISVYSQIIKYSQRNNR